MKATESIDYDQIVNVLKRTSNSKQALSSARDEVVWENESLVLQLLDSVPEQEIQDRLQRDELWKLKSFVARLCDEAQIRRARKDPNDFIEYCFRDDNSGEPMRQADFHREWQDTMGKHKQVILIGPRGHGKSGQVIGRILWELGNNPNLRIKIVCNNDEKARDRVLEIQTHIGTNQRVQKVFPGLRPAEQSRWTTDKLFIQRDQVMRDPSVEGGGVLSSATGGRCDILIMDDVADRKNSLTHPSMRESVKEAVKSDWMALLVDGGWAVSICTLWHKKDLNHELGGDALREYLRGRVPDQSGIEKGQWYVSFRAVGANFEPVWPEKWPKEKLEEKYRQVGRSAFNRGWRNIATDDTETVVDLDWIQYYKPLLLPSKENMVVIQSYDLALSSNPTDKNSYFACVTFGLSVDHINEIYVIDYFQAQINFPEQVRAVIRGYERFKPQVILMESVYYQAALAQYFQHHTLYPIVGVKPHVSKKMRLEGVSPQLESGNVKFNPRMDPKGGHAILSRGDLVTALCEFPFGDDQDLVDAFTQGVGYLQQHQLELVNNKRQGGAPKGKVYSIGKRR